MNVIAGDICDRLHWKGILVSDGYGVSRKWVGLRQTCLAHLFRDAKKLSVSLNIDIISKLLNTVNKASVDD